MKVVLHQTLRLLMGLNKRFLMHGINTKVSLLQWTCCYINNKSKLSRVYFMESSIVNFFEWGLLSKRFIAQRIFEAEVNESMTRSTIDSAISPGVFWAHVFCYIYFACEWNLFPSIACRRWMACTCKMARVWICLMPWPFIAEILARSWLPWTQIPVGCSLDKVKIYSSVFSRRCKSGHFDHR